MTTAIRRTGLLTALALAAASAVALSPVAAFAADTPAKPPAGKAATVKTATIKAGKGQKVCRVRLKYTGEIRTWICRKEEPCCVWHEINYVKCGSTITGCL
jgi:hypothetical protein